jgi:hypothetical protein
MIAYPSLIFIILISVLIGGGLMFLSRPQSRNENGKSTIINSVFSSILSIFKFLSKIFIFAVILILPFALLKLVGK